MASPQRILVLGTSHGGGNGSPLAAGDSGPSPFRAWAEACLPAVRALVSDFRPRVVLSEFFIMELARLTKATCGLQWRCVNPGYYFGSDSTRPFEADFVGRTRYYIQQFLQAVGEANLVLHGTDPLFDPPPPSLPRHHHYVRPLWWERSSEAPTYLDVPGAPWVLGTVSSNPQAGEMTLAWTTLRTLAEHPVHVVLSLTARHPRDELSSAPANARIELFVPHSAVLKRSCLLVSHPGHGIVAKAFYYGVPMIEDARGRPGHAAAHGLLGAPAGRWQGGQSGADSLQADTVDHPEGQGDTSYALATPGGVDRLTDKDLLTIKTVATLRFGFRQRLKAGVMQEKDR